MAAKQESKKHDEKHKGQIPGPKGTYITLNTNECHHMLTIAGLPIIGNLLDIDVTNSLQSIIDMAKDYRTLQTTAVPDSP